MGKEGRKKRLELRYVSLRIFTKTLVSSLPLLLHSFFSTVTTSMSKCIRLFRSEDFQSWPSTSESNPVWFASLLTREVTWITQFLGFGGI